MEHEDAEGTHERGRATLLVAVAAAASAGASYAVMWVATHTLSKPDATVFLTILAVLFFAYGLMSGLATEITRSSASAQRDGRRVGPSLWQVATVAAVVCSSAVALFVLGWHHRLLGEGSDLSDAVPVALLLALGVAGYSFHSTAVGALTGRRQWSGSATVIGAEAGGRLLLTAVAAVAGAGLLGMLSGTAVAALAVLVVLLLAPSVRRAMGAATDRPGGQLSRRIAQSMLAQASAAAVVVGFPVLLTSTTSPSDYRDAAPLILAVSLTRAPLLIPLNASQGIVVSYLVHARRRIGRALVVVAGAITGVGALGSLAAWAIGPWLMAGVFGADYRVDGWVLALLTLSATLLALLTLTGATCQAADRHAVFLGGWLLATVVTAALLLLPGDLEQRSVVALLGGPAAGLVLHVATLVRRASSISPTDTEGAVRVDA